MKRFAKALGFLAGAWMCVACFLIIRETRTDSLAAAYVLTLTRFGYLTGFVILVAVGIRGSLDLVFRQFAKRVFRSAKLDVPNDELEGKLLQVNVDRKLGEFAAEFLACGKWETETKNRIAELVKGGDRFAAGEEDALAELRALRDKVKFIEKRVAEAQNRFYDTCVAARNLDFVVKGSVHDYATA